MSKWWLISPNSEILLMTLIGLATTIMESIYMNLRENIKEVWMLTFPEELISTGLEHLIKTILSGVVIARGATVHASLASYLLIIYPVITEKLRIMLVVWMVIAALRSIAINIIITCTGCVLCASYPDIRPVCFEFVITKAVELACSIFMWVNVNDFYHYLKKKQRNASSNTDKITTSLSNKSMEQLKKGEMEESIDSYTLSLSKSLLEKIKDGSSNDAYKDASSINSLIANTAVQWLVKTAFNAKSRKAFTVDDTKVAEMFLAMSIDDIIKLQEQVRKSLEMIKENIDGPVNEDQEVLNSESKTVSTVSKNSEHLEIIDRIISDSVTDDVNKVENSKNIQVECSYQEKETNCEEKDLFINKIRQDLGIMKLSNSKNETEEECDLLEYEHNILGEIDQTTIIRAIYERKFGDDMSANCKPSKKIIWKRKEEIANPEENEDI